MSLSSKSIRCALLLIIAAGVSIVAGQNAAPTNGKDNPKPEKSSSKPAKSSSKKDNIANVTAEQVAETAILIYAFPGGRATMNQIRKTASERGKITLTDDDGTINTANYQKWSLRGETLPKEKIRFEQEFPNAKYSLVQADEKVFGVFNDSLFEPREDARHAFENQIYRSLDTLLRYKENESKLEFIGREKYMGVDYYVIDITDSKDRKTRFYSSVKTSRVMMLDYEENGFKYRRKFYNYKYAQGVLVPYTTALWKDNKQIEETQVGTITFGQKVDEGLFVFNAAN